jgi:hypothetical protein
MAHRVEEPGDVGVEDEVHAPPGDPGRQCVQRIVLAASRPKAVAEPQEVLLPDRIQHLDHRALNDLVLQRPVGAAVNTVLERREPGLEVLAVFPPRHPVHPRCRVFLQPAIGCPQEVDVDVVEEYCEPLPFLLFGPLPYTVQPGGHACPSQCSARAVLDHAPLGPRPWLHRLRGRSPVLVRQLPSYYGEARLLLSVHHRLRPSGLPDAGRRARGATVRKEISRFPREELRYMLGSSTTQGRSATRLTCRAVLPSAHATASAPWTFELSRLNTQTAPSPVNASPRPSRAVAHDSGPVWIATPSPCRTLTDYSLPVSRHTACFEMRLLVLRSRRGRRLEGGAPQHKGCRRWHWGMPSS